MIDLSVSPDLEKWSSTKKYEMVRLQILPATLYASESDTGVSRANFIVKQDWTIDVFIDHPEGITRLWTGALAEEALPPKVDNKYVFVTTDGPLLAYKSKGCLCGTKLRSIFPYRVTLIG